MKLLFMKIAMLQLAIVLLISGLVPSHATNYYTFVVSDAPYTRLCSNKSILTVNGLFPGPTINATQGETIIVNVINNSTQNISIHWHGVKQPRNPWSDGPEYITQCPIRPGTSFNQTIVLSDEIGTLWWHAHSDWSRATVYGALVVNPKNKADYPFAVPYGEFPVILGDWWKSDIQSVLSGFLANGGDPNSSDAYVINGQPGDQYLCSKPDMFQMKVESGKTYLIRLINNVMNNIMFVGIASHNLTVVGTDGAYVKPFTSDTVAISPGQTIDLLLEANQQPSHYYMAARPYAISGSYDNTTTTAMLVYNGKYTVPSNLTLPTLPDYNDTLASTSFTGRFRSKDNASDVPLNVTTSLFFTVSINTKSCVNDSCSGPSGERLLASVNNITFETPTTDILSAYYKNTTGVYDTDFPSNPPDFNFTSDDIPASQWRSENGTRVKVLKYNSTVEIVFQGTNIVSALDHPMHLHGYSFYVVGWGFGNFNKVKDPLTYNLVDPPLQNTIAVPVSGWTAIRFTANNPGVWFMHCHFERHASWGMEMAFIVEDGDGKDDKMRSPPPDMPIC